MTQDRVMSQKCTQGAMYILKWELKRTIVPLNFTLDDVETSDLAGMSMTFLLASTPIKVKQKQHSTK